MRPFDDTGSFRALPPDEELRRAAVRGAGVTVLSHNAAFAMQLIATVVLARLLTPEDFGLLAMVTTFSLLLLNAGLNGFTEVVLQREQMDHDLASNFFWINAGLGLLLATVLAALGPLLARVYGEPRVSAVAGAMALTILFTCLSVQHLALLKRAMRFSALSANDIVARAVSVAVSVPLAWMGWGYWALVAGAVALSLATSVGAWTVCRWVPGRPRRGVGTGPAVRFAMNTYARFVMSYVTWNLDNLLVGWRFGPASLGYYKKAYDLFAMPSNLLSAPLNAVAVSTLSRLTGQQHGRYVLGALSTLAFVGMAVGADLTLVGSDVVRLVLGPDWGASGRIFTFFGPGIGVMLLHGAHGWIHLSIGRPDRWARWGIVELVVTTTLFIVGLPWGPVGVAVGWVSSYWILTVPALWYAGRPVDLRLGSIIGVVWRYAVAAALAGGATAAIVQALPTVAEAAGAVGAAGRIAVTSVIFGSLYLGAVLLFHRGSGPLTRVAEVVRSRDHRSLIEGLLRSRRTPARR